MENSNNPVRILYVCHFYFKGEVRKAYTSSVGKSMFSAGFWVNADMQLIHGEGSVFWIPPSKINYVEKRTVPSYCDGCVHLPLKEKPLPSVKEHTTCLLLDIVLYHNKERTHVQPPQLCAHYSGKDT